MTRLKRDPFEKRRRNFPVNITFKQFRHYLDVLREGGEEQLWRTIQEEEPDEPPVVTTVPTTRRSRSNAPKAIGTSISEQNEQLTHGRENAEGHGQASKHGGEADFRSNTTQVKKHKKSTVKKEFQRTHFAREHLIGDISTLNYGVKGDVKMKSMPTRHDDDNDSRLNVVASELEAITAIKQKSGNFNNAKHDNSPGWNTGWASDMKTVALEKYLDGLAEKEKDFLRKHDTGKWHGFNQHSYPQHMSKTIRLPLINQHSAHRQKSKESVRVFSSECRKDERAKVLPICWSSHLVEEDFSTLEDHVKRTKSSKSKRSSASSHKPNSSHEGRRRKTSEPLQEPDAPSDRRTPQKNDQRRASLVGAPSLERRTSVTSTRRSSLLPTDLDATSFLFSRRSSFPTDARSVKSAASSAGSARGSRGEGRNRNPRLNRERSRLSLVYRADPPIPLRLYVHRKEGTDQRYVDGVTDDKGLPLLPTARRHIMTGLVYHKVSRSLVPPRPLDMRTPVKPPSTASSRSGKTPLFN